MQAPASQFALRDATTNELISPDNMARLLDQGSTLKLVPAPAIEAAQLVEKLRGQSSQALKQATFSLRSFIRVSVWFRIGTRETQPSDVKAGRVRLTLRLARDLCTNPLDVGLRRKRPLYTSFRGSKAPQRWRTSSRVTRATPWHTPSADYRACLTSVWAWMSSTRIQSEG